MDLSDGGLLITDCALFLGISLFFEDKSVLGSSAGRNELVEIGHRLALRCP
jgi:hypothetical protein